MAQSDKRSRSVLCQEGVRNVKKVEVRGILQSSCTESGIEEETAFNTKELAVQECGGDKGDKGEARSSSEVGAAETNSKEGYGA